MLDETVKRLLDPTQRLTHKLLRGLSGLDRAGLSTVRQAWLRIAAPRRRQIITGLTEMTEDDMELDFEDLFQTFLSDPDEEARAGAVAALWESTDQRLVDPMIALMQKDPSPRVRAAAGLTLGHFAMLAADGKLRGGRAARLLDALLHTFRSGDDAQNTPEVRRNAVEAAAFFSDDPRVAQAIKDAYADGDLLLRAGAIAAMGFTYDLTWAPLVVKELSSAEPELRFEAARSAGDLELQSAVPRLIAMTEDPDPEVCLMAATALGEIGGKAAQAALQKLTRGPNEALAEAAEEALQELLFNADPLSTSDAPVPGRAGKKTGDEPGAN